MATSNKQRLNPLMKHRARLAKTAKIGKVAKGKSRAKSNGKRGEEQPAKG